MSAKRKKLLFCVLGLLLVAAVLFVPLPAGTYEDGGTREYAALTYKLVIWNRMEAAHDADGRITAINIYQNTSVYFFPDNLKSLDELWDLEQARRSD